MPRDPYEVLGVGRAAGETEIKKAFRRLARELHPDTNSEDPQAEDKFKEAAEAYEILSDPERRRQYDAYGHEGLRSGGYAPNFEGFGSVSDLFSAFFGSGGFDSAFGTGRGRGGQMQGADVGRRGRDRPRRRRRAARPSRSPTKPTFAATPATATAPSPARRSSPARAATARASCRPCRGRRFGQLVRTAVCDVCGGDGRVAERPCATCCRPGQAARVAHAATSTSPPASPTASGSGSAVAATPATAAARTATSTSRSACARTSASCATRRTCTRCIDVAAPLAALGTTVQVPSLDGDIAVEIPAGTQPGEIITLRSRGLPPLQRGRTGDLHVHVNVDHPAQAEPRAARPARAPRGLAHRRQPERGRGDARQAEARAGGMSRDNLVRLGIRVRRDAGRDRARGAAADPAGRRRGDRARPGRDRVRGLRAARRAALARRHPGARRRGADRRHADRVPPGWERRWHQYLQPVEIAAGGRRLRIRPPWLPAGDDETLEVVIDPGELFGAGTHPTTRLCLELLLALDAGRPAVRLGRRQRDPRDHAPRGWASDRSPRSR